MKRPAAITAALVSLSIAFALTLVSVAGPLPPGYGLGVRAFYLLFGLVHVVGFVGLLRRRRWAVYWSAALFALYSLGVLVVVLMSARQLHSLLQAAFGVLFAGLIAWLVIALLRSPEVRVYTATANRPPLPAAGGAA